MGGLRARPKHEERTPPPDERIENPTQVVEPIDIYRSSWLIEECNKALKTGCRYEHRQFEGCHALLVLPFWAHANCQPKLPCVARLGTPAAALAGAASYASLRGPRVW